MAFEHSDPYETWKQGGRPGGSFAEWDKNRNTGATDAPQVQSAPPPTQAPQQKEGKGGAGWNEDFDEQWGRRVLENPQLKERFGLSDYSSLRDEETRRAINRWLRENKGKEAGGGTQATSTQAPAAASTTAPGAGEKAGAKEPVQPAGTTGKTSFTAAKAAGAVAAPAASSAVVRAGRRPTQSLLWRNTVVPVSGGTIPALQGPWWPSYPAGNAPPATRSGTAAVQAMALEEQRS